MPNDGTGANWDEVDPEGTDSASVGAQEIRDLRIGLRLRLGKEHVDPAAASVGGEHEPGSAKAYYNGAAPTTRPDGTALSAADNGRIWVDAGVAKYYSHPSWLAITGVAAAQASAVLRQSLAQGTGGGVFTSGAFRTRALNDEMDPSGIVTLAANQFTLAAGTYLIDASLPAFRVANHVSRLQNITDGTTTLIGSSEYSGNASTSAQTRSVIRGTITIAGAKTFELQHRCEQTYSNAQAFGYTANAWGQNEIHSIVTITKLS